MNQKLAQLLFLITLILIYFVSVSFTLYNSKGFFFTPSLQVVKTDSLPFRSINNTLTKVAQAPIIQTSNFELCEGDTTFLTISNTIETAEYTWFRNGEPFLVIQEDELEKNIEVSQEGVYSVRYNEGGQFYLYSNEVKITVVPKPVLKLVDPQASTSIIAKVGEEVVLPKMFSEDPHVKIAWYAKDKELFVDGQGDIKLKLSTSGTYSYTAVGTNTQTQCFTNQSIIVTVFDSADCPVAHQRIWASKEDKFGFLTGRVSNSLNAVDGKPDTYSTLSVYLGVLGIGTVWQKLFFSEEQKAGTPVSIKLGKEYSGLVVAGGLSVVGIDAKGKDIGIIEGVDGGVIDLLAGDNVIEYSFVPSNNKGMQNYWGVRVVLSATLSVGQNAKVYGAYIKKTLTQSDLDQGVNCRAVSSEINPNVLDVLHGVEDLGLGIASATASVVNPWKAVDNDINSYASLSRGVAVLNQASLTVVFKQTTLPGDELAITIADDNIGILSLELIKGFTIQRYLGDQKVGEKLDASNGLLRLRLLGIGNKKRVQIIVGKSTIPFDRVKIAYGNVVGLLGDVIKIYNVEILPSLDLGIPPIVEDGIEYMPVLDLCEGDLFQISPTNGICTQYDVFIKEEGEDKLVPSADIFSFKVGDQLPLDILTTVYVQAYRNGCIIGSRYPVKVRINSRPEVTNIERYDANGVFLTTVSETSIKGGKVVVLKPIVKGEIKHYKWMYQLEGEAQWKPFAFASVDQPIVEYQSIEFQRDSKGSLILDNQESPIIENDPGYYIIQPGDGSLKISFPKNGIVDGQSYHKKKSKVRLVVTSIWGCEAQAEITINWLKGYIDRIYSNPSLSSNTYSKQ